MSLLLINFLQLQYLSNTIKITYTLTNFGLVRKELITRDKRKKRGMNVNVSGQWIRLKSAVDVRLRPKCFRVFRSVELSHWLQGVTFSLGIYPCWIKSLLIFQEAHSPIPVHRLLRASSLFLSVSFSLLYSFFSLVLFASFPRSSALPRPANFVAMFFVAPYKKPLPAPTGCRIQDEFYIFADSFIVAGLDDRVNKRLKVLFLRSRASCERTYRKNLARDLSPSLFISIDRWDR